LGRSFGVVMVLAHLMYRADCVGMGFATEPSRACVPVVRHRPNRLATTCMMTMGFSCAKAESCGHTSGSWNCR
jgi:hypothetical protein